MNDQHLEGRVAIVTGGGKNIGRAIALALAKQGARVLVNNRAHPGETKGSAERVCDEIRDIGGQAVPNIDSIEQPGAAAHMVEQTIEAFGRLDIVVNNAAVAPQQRISNLPEATLREAFEINYFGPVALTQAALPALRESGAGRLLYIISNGGLYGGDGLGAYASTKAALYALMRTMAVEGQRFGISANALAPFAVSQMTDQAMQGALRDALTADWIGPVAAALCSPHCALTGKVYVTGAGRVREARVAETNSEQFAADATAETLLQLLQKLGSAAGLHHFEHAVQGFFHSMGDLTGTSANSPP